MVTRVWNAGRSCFIVWAMVLGCALFTGGWPITADAADREFGEYLSGQCTSCHQVSGKSKGIPAIVGWDAESFVAVMNSYKKKERDNKVMQNIAGTLSAEEIAALAAYFGSLPMPEQTATPQ